VSSACIYAAIDSLQIKVNTPVGILLHNERAKHSVFVGKRDSWDPEMEKLCWPDRHLHLHRYIPEFPPYTVHPEPPN
jgi:hypothetical protein